MNGKIYLAIHYLVCWSIPICVSTSNTSVAQNAEQRLMRDLFRDYNPVARPVLNASSSSLVNISFVLNKLQQLNIKTETMTTSGYLRVSWMDERLRWDPKLYDGLENIVVSPVMVWLPDFVLYNRVGDVVYTEEHYKLCRVQLQSDGLCHWAPGGEFKSQCLSDVTFFPFDKQQCSLVFGNWAYSSAAINLTYRSCAHQELLSSYAQNGEWEIVRTEITHVDRYYNDCCGCSKEPFPEVEFQLYVQRKSLYYTMTIVVPSLILSALVLMVLWLPSDSGEKMSMGVTLLLSFTVFILALTESVPHTSEAVPIILIYVLVFMGITCLTVASSVIVLILHHTHITTPPSAWLLRLGWVLNSKAMEGLQVLHRINARVEQMESGHTVTMKKLHQRKSLKVCNLKAQNAAGAANPTQVVLFQILAEFQTQADRRYRSDLRKERLIEWRVVATALDRLVFWVILVLFLATFLVAIFIVPITAQ